MMHFILAFTVCISVIDAKVCLKNDDIGHRTGNVYECNDPVLNACCEMEGDFTCCEPSYNKHLREQLQLWGCVTLFVIVIVIVYVYMRRDVQVFGTTTFMEGFHDLKSKFNCRYKQNEGKYDSNGIEDNLKSAKENIPMSRISNVKSDNQYTDDKKADVKL